VYICQPVVDRGGDVRTVDDDVIRDVVVAEFARWRLAALDVAAVLDRVVVDGVAGPRVGLGDAGVERDALVSACPQVRAPARQALRRVDDLNRLRLTRCVPQTTIH